MLYAYLTFQAWYTSSKRKVGKLLPHKFQWHATINPFHRRNFNIHTYRSTIKFWYHLKVIQLYLYNLAYLFLQL